MLSFSVNPDITKIVVEGTMTEARPTTDQGRQWWSELWFKSLQEKTDFNANPDAYGYACDTNTRYNTSKRQTALLTSDDFNSGATHGVAESVAFHVDSTIDDVLDRAEVKSLVSEFLDLHEYILIEEGKDIWSIMKLILDGNKNLKQELASLLSRNNASDFYIKFFKNTGAYDAVREVLA